MRIYVLLPMLFFLCCKEYYEPPALKNTPHYLVVEGRLTSAPDSTYVTLTYTRSMSDSAPAQPALNARLVVEGDQNTSFALPEIGAGRYGNMLNLSTSEQYKLTITTSDGRQYSSSFVPFKQTPPIDSLSWTQDSSEVKFYLDTHDPQNRTIYYRWHFTETWQYTTYLTSMADYVNDSVVLRTPDQQIYNCWKTNNAATILLATTTGLSEDIVSRFHFNSVSKSLEQLHVRYSVEVSQYALSKEEFNYWTELKKNSEQLGSLFDAQPSQLQSNISCVSNPGEPVLGYLSASTIQKKRIFVGINELDNSNYKPYYLPCYVLKDVTTGIAPTDKQKAYEYLESPNHLFTFWYDDGAYHLAQNFCIDCREHGGTNIKPSFWP